MLSQSRTDLFSNSFPARVAVQAYLKSAKGGRLKTQTVLFCLGTFLAVFIANFDWASANPSCRCLITQKTKTIEGGTSAVPKFYYKTLVIFSSGRTLESGAFGVDDTDVSLFERYRSEICQKSIHTILDDRQIAKNTSEVQELRACGLDGRQNGKKSVRHSGTR